MLRVATLMVLAATACGANIEAEAPPAQPRPAEQARAKLPSSKAEPIGWRATDAGERKRIEEFARAYAAYLGAAKTPRRAIDGLVTLVKGAKRLEPGSRPKLRPGSRLWLPGPGGKAAAFVLVGKRPIEEGARIVVASIDAPRIDLEQRPLHNQVGFAMLDTAIYGAVDLKSWLVHPLALYIHAVRPGAKSGDARIVIGEAANDPVLVIPDLLPHLSGRVQRKQIVDSAERMDAIAARSQKALFDLLRKNGVDRRVFLSAEASLVPAGGPTFIGVDRALLAGYGHGHRALAFAAAHSLSQAKAAEHTAILIAINKGEVGYTGSSGTAFVQVALTTIIAALAAEADADLLTERQVHARSAALIAHGAAGKRNRGVVLSFRRDDSLPAAARRVLDSLRKAKARYQIVNKGGWGSPSRRIARLDLDAADIGLPITGHGTPAEVVSTYDLYQARRAMQGWLLE